MFFQPHTIEEALALKREHGAAAAFIAGGTDLIVMMNRGRCPAKNYIDLSHIPGLDEIKRARNDNPPADRMPPGAAEIYTAGCCATFSRLAELPVTCLAGAALSVGGPQIRNRGTIAGNIVSASPAGDGSTALLSLDAALELRNANGPRLLPLRDFFLDYRKTALADDEMIVSIRFPAAWKSAWQKLGKRGAMNISMVCCSCAVSESGRFYAAFGSAGPNPMKARRTEEFLTGAAVRTGDGGMTLSGKAIDEAARIAQEEVQPIDDFRGAADYRRAMAGVLLKRALRQIIA
ncbi:MAG: FAD binding domain-containing protein [bacterium]